MSQRKKCVVGYKTALTESGHVYGHVFSKLDECCEEFGQWFLRTGNTKVDNFNAGDGAPYNEKNGFNFVTRGGNLEMELRLGDPFKTGVMKFCFSCGAEIEIKETAKVTLQPKHHKVFAGYEEFPK